MTRTAAACIFGFLAISFAISQPASAKTLAVPQVNQMPQTNWCWAASSQAVLSYTGNAPGMCTIVDYVRALKAWGNDNCCVNGTGAICNRPNSLAGFASAQAVLTHWGAESEYIRRPLSSTEVTESIDDDSPSIVEWRPNNGGTVGHAVVLYGSSGSSVTVMDPMDGPTSMSYSALLNNAIFRWGGTLRVKPLKITYVVDDTGSMGDDIANVRSTILAQIDGYISAGRFVKYTLITYKDSVNFVGSTTSGTTIKGWIGGLTASGGDDCPEEGYGALDQAAEKAPRSEVWWMTDADSHGGFLRMLQTRARLLFARCTLHSAILGACTAPASAVTSQADSSPSSKTPTSIPLAHALPNADVSAITAGESLSTATGGLFFTITSGNLANATKIITEEMDSNAFLRRRSLAPGTTVSAVPVDASVAAMKITLDLASGASGTLSIKNPFGATVVAGNPGVQEIIAGFSRMVILTPPALVAGTFEIATNSSMAYFLSVSAASPHELTLTSNTTVGVGIPKLVKVQIATLVPPTLPLGPGAGAPIDNMTSAFPYDRAKLKFYRETEDGTGRLEVDLFDDGLHDDSDAGDGIYGGNVAFANPGRYRLIGAIAQSSFERATKLLISAGQVSLSGPSDQVGRPATTLSHSFTLQNLTASTKTFDLGITSAPNWAIISGIPANVTLAAGASSSLIIPVAIPATATKGESSLLGVTAVAQDDPSVTDSVFIQTSVWTGPLLQGISGSPATRGGTLTLLGAGFGADPGTGNRSSSSHRVILGGSTLPDANVVAWNDTAIQIIVPIDAVSGLLHVVVAADSSNQLPVTVVLSAATGAVGVPSLSAEAFLILTMLIALAGVVAIGRRSVGG